VRGAILARRREPILLSAPRGLPPRLASPAAPPPWQLRCLSLCGSTEHELSRWLERQPPADVLEQPRLVVARRQRCGHGQRGRRWESPAGGVWLSAAMPWPADPQAAAAPALAVALALAEALAERGAPVRLKWPNDLLLLTPQGPRKLAGLLPGLRLRGATVRWARIGIGLNGRNPVPAGAANLRGQARLHHGEPLFLTALVLLALERAMALAAEPAQVRRRAEALLEPTPPLWLEEAWWQPLGLACDGGLRLGHPDGHERILRRF